MNTTDEVRTAAELWREVSNKDESVLVGEEAVACLRAQSLLANAYLDLASRADTGGEREPKLEALLKQCQPIIKSVVAKHWSKCQCQTCGMCDKIDAALTPAAPQPTPASRERERNACQLIEDAADVDDAIERQQMEEEGLAALSQPTPTADLLDGVDYREGHNRDNRTPDELREIVRQMADRLAALQSFKNWVHAYLDKAGIPTHPDGPHSKEGCRIGDRMDLLARRNIEEINNLQTCLRSLLLLQEGMESDQESKT